MNYCLISLILVYIFSSQLQVYLRDSEILSSDCECPRGDHKCPHAAAIVIHGIHNLSRTDVECKWKKQKPSKEVKSFEEMYPCTKKYQCLKRDVSEEDRSWFFQELKNYGSFTGTLWLLFPEPTKVLLPIKTVEEIVLSENFVNHNDQKTFIRAASDN